jgi:NodT family efflux transporter outer membrane factor (OMF) lipoprotein
MPSARNLPRTRKLNLHCAAAAILTIGLSACTTGPAFQPEHTAITPGNLSATRPPEASSSRNSTIPRDWWTLFHDQTLNTLITEADSTNLDLQQAALRVEESQAELGLVDSKQQPQLGFGAAYTRQAISAKSPLAHLGASTYGFDQWQAGFQASWEIDLWGYLRKQSESARASLEASAYGREAVRIAISSDVARTYLQLRGAQVNAGLSAESTRLAAQIVQLMESRERNGTASAMDVEAVRAKHAEFTTRTLQLNLQCETLMNALALLLGKDPQQLNAQLSVKPALPALPVEIPQGIPSELARRRPDILQAEARLHAATADIGAAEADFYPRIRLAGSFGSQAFTGRDLGMWKARQFSISPSFYLPIFDGGRLKRNLALTETRQRLAALAYRQTVLRAWHEVDNQLNTLASTRQRHQQFDLASGQYLKTVAHTRLAMQQGAADRLSLITAEQALLASQQALSESQTASAIAIVDLYKVLGGGWWSADSHQKGQAAS